MIILLFYFSGRIFSLSCFIFDYSLSLPQRGSFLYFPYFIQFLKAIFHSVLPILSPLLGFVRHGLTVLFMP